MDSKKMPMVIASERSVRHKAWRIRRFVWWKRSNLRDCGACPEHARLLRPFGARNDGAFCSPRWDVRGIRQGLLAMTSTLLLFAGCFDTQFDFKTVVRRDGSILRETRIDGRGANLFKVPQGPGWQSKSSQTQGEEAFTANTYYHVLAQGQFRPGQPIPSDYELDIEKQLQSWGEEEKSRLRLAGVEPPYPDHLFSKNRIKVSTFKGWLTSTTFYEETFQTAGVIDVLLIDLKEEVRKQSAGRGEVFQEAELEQLAQIRLVDEVLPEIKFRSEVTLPGKILSSNAERTERNNKVVWEFSLKNFEKNHSLYTLTATSKSLQLPGIVFLIGITLLLFAITVLVGFGIHRQGELKKKGGRLPPRGPEKKRPPS